MKVRVLKKCYIYDHRLKEGQEIELRDPKDFMPGSMEDIDGVLNAKANKPSKSSKSEDEELDEVI
jgi:hypothetical protein